VVILSQAGGSTYVFVFPLSLLNPFATWNNFQKEVLLDLLLGFNFFGYFLSVFDCLDHMLRVRLFFFAFDLLELGPLVVVAVPVLLRDAVEDLLPIGWHFLPKVTNELHDRSGRPFRVLPLYLFPFVLAVENVWA
jgi:hypothetical protein